MHIVVSQSRLALKPHGYDSLNARKHNNTGLKFPDFPGKGADQKASIARNKGSI